MNAPLISVIIPYLRAETTIRRAVDSVLAQDFQDFEIVTVGDGSVDRTTDIVTEYAKADQRFRMLTYAENHGPSFARNRGIEVARGQWISVLDADDWFGPTRLGSMMGMADLGDVIVDNMMGIDPFDGSEVGPMFASFGSRLSTAQVASLVVAGSKFDYGYLKPIFRKKLIIDHAIRYRENLRTAEDLLFLLECCARAGSIIAIDQPLYYYNLQVSEKSKRSRGTSHTAPRDREVASALFDLLGTLSSVLTRDEVRVIEKRANDLLLQSEVSDFRHHLRQARYRRALTLFMASKSVRTYLGLAIKKKLVNPR